MSTNSSPPTPRLVLVEFSSVGGFHGLPVLPFVKGAVQQAGGQVRWLRFAADPAIQFQTKGPGIALEDEDREHLCRVLTRINATHLIFSQQPSQTLLDHLRRVHPQLGVAVVSQVPLSPGQPTNGPTWLPLSVRPLVLWALAPAIPSPDLDLFAAPDFALELANPGARSAPLTLMLVCSDSCTYNKPLEESRFFAARTLPDLPQRFGCTFCNKAAFSPLFQELQDQSPHTLLARQLEAARETLRRGPGPLGLRVLSQRLASTPEDLARLIVAAELPSLALQLEYRTDQIGALLPALEEASRLLSRSGHRLEVCLMGVESFSTRQLDRYHKGLGPLTNLLAIKALWQLSESLGPGFELRASGGLSTILFDPWTSPADLGINLAVIQHFGLLDFARKLLGSRLRLYEGLPLTRAARAEGLLLDAYQDPRLDTARRTLYPAELPWRFADPRLEPLCGLSLALSQEATPDLELVLKAAELVAASPAVLTEAGLLHDAQVLLTRPPPLLPRLPRILEGGEPGGAAGALNFRLVDLAGFAAGLKPVMKLELPLDDGAAGAALRWLLRAFPGTLGTWRRPAWGEGRFVEIFLSRDRALAQRAEEVAAFLDRRPPGPQSLEADLELGRLLGYPACCSQAFIRVGSVTTSGFEWLRVRRLLEGSGASHTFLPLLVPWVPCALDCPATRRYLETLLTDPAAAPWLDRWGAGFGRAPGVPWRQWGDLPVLQFLKRPGDFVVLRPLGHLNHPFPYQVVAAATADPRLEALLQGDTLALEPGLLRVEAGGRETAFFALDAFLWTPGLPPHRDFWRHCAEQALGGARPKASGTNREGAQAPGGPPPAAQCLALQRHLTDLLASPPAAASDPMAGFVLVRTRASAEGPQWGRLTLELQRGQEDLILFLEPALPNRPAYRRCGSINLSHARPTPPDSPPRQRAMDTICRLLDEYSFPD